MPNILKIENVIDGMQLAEPVLNKLGQVILGKNSVLTSKHINTLKLWGIKEISIKTNDNEINDMDNFIISEEIKLKIRNELGWQSTNNFINELIEIAAIINMKNANL